MPHDPYKALYLHIPFCVKKCAYCDFTSYQLPRDHREIDEYVEQLVMEIRRKSKAGELAAIDTVYIGGGTPSHIGQKHLGSLLYALSLSMRLEPDVECTMEANPESLTIELIRDVWALGVNRLSIGVQSFDDAVLATLGRAHTAADAIAAIEAARSRFENVSVDLMCGIPGQSVESFRNSVEKAISLGVTHVSIYPLTIEAGTPFAKAVRRGKMAMPDEDVEAECMEVAQAVLEQAGFHRYEVASYAKPEFECRHNVAYWTGVPYLGLGTSAATMTQNSERRMRLKDGIITDDLDPRQMAAEDLMLNMRMSRGASMDGVRALSGMDGYEESPRFGLLPDALRVFDELSELGLVVAQDGRYKPTQRGWLCGNELFGRIFELAP